MAKVLISDSINSHIVGFLNWEEQNLRKDCLYPYIRLDSGERFYFNQFLFL